MTLNTWWPQELAAQIAVWKPGQKDFPRPVQQTTVNGSSKENVHVIALSPMAEPVPALKYRFWTTPALREPGRVNEAMSRALVLYLSHPKRDALEKQYAERAEQWLDSQTIESDLKGYLDDQREILRVVYRGAELDTIEPRSVVRELRGRAALGASLSEIQTLRNLTRLVQLDAHAAISEKRYDAAIASISAGFRLAEYAQKLGDANLVSGLVSLALSGLTMHAVDELSRQPDAPNLYWALASLPDELWSMRSAVEGESQSIARVLYPLLEPAAPDMTDSDWDARLVEAVQTIVASDANPFDASAIRADEEATERTARLVVGLILLAFSDRAAQELIDSGFTRGQVDEMSASEAVARSIQLRFEQRRDDLFKWALLGSAAKSYSSSEWQRFAQQSRTGEFILPAHTLLGLVIPAIQAGDAAALRGNTQHKQLLLCEALRAHAAAHDGKLPDSLAGLQPLPTLPNPNTGELFEYQKVSDSEAIIRRQSFYPGDKNEIHIQLRASHGD